MAHLTELRNRINRRLTRELPIKRVKSRLERPTASISFDDFPRSAWTTAGPILERHGVKATYFVAGGLCGRTVEGLEQFTAADLGEVRDAGHEIACHTFSHTSTPKLGDDDLERECAENAAFIADAAPGQAIVSFAYPYGDASLRTKAWCARRFAVSRGIQAGANADAIDLAELKAAPLEHRAWSRSGVEARVRQTVRDNGWLVLFTHDVSNDPSPFGATPEMLDHALETLRREGVDILPIRAALPRAVFGAG